MNPKAKSGGTYTIGTKTLLTWVLAVEVHTAIMIPPCAIPTSARYYSDQQYIPR